MSSTLCYEPIIEQETYTLPDHIKLILETRYGATAILDKSDVAYLTGLNDAGVGGAEQLIEIISKHGKVRVWVEY